MTKEEQLKVAFKAILLEMVEDIKTTCRVNDDILTLVYAKRLFNEVKIRTKI